MLVPGNVVALKEHDPNLRYIRENTTSILFEVVTANSESLVVKVLDVTLDFNYIGLTTQAVTLVSPVKVGGKVKINPETTTFQFGDNPGMRNMQELGVILEVVGINKSPFTGRWRVRAVEWEAPHATTYSYGCKELVRAVPNITGNMVTEQFTDDVLTNPAAEVDAPEPIGTISPTPPPTAWFNPYHISVTVNPKNKETQKEDSFWI